MRALWVHPHPIMRHSRDSIATSSLAPLAALRFCRTPQLVPTELLAADLPGHGTNIAIPSPRPHDTCRPVAVGRLRLFFFVYSLLACDLWRSWREYVRSVSCPLSAQWRLVASTPFALRPGLSRECVVRTKKTTKGKKASVQNKRKGHRKSVAQSAPLRRSRRCHEVGRG